MVSHQSSPLTIKELYTVEKQLLPEKICYMYTVYPYYLFIIIKNSNGLFKSDTECIKNVFTKSNSAGWTKIK